MDAKSLIVLAGVTLLTACVAVENAEPVPVAPERPDQCGASKYQSLIGKPGSGVDQSALPEPYRVICHGCMVTKDYRINRLNVWLDEAGVVDRVDCG